MSFALKASLVVDFRGVPNTMYRRHSHKPPRTSGSHWRSLPSRSELRDQALAAVLGDATMLSTSRAIEVPVPPRSASLQMRCSLQKNPPPKKGSLRNRHTQISLPLIGGVDWWSRGWEVISRLLSARTRGSHPIPNQLRAP